MGGSRRGRLPSLQTGARRAAASGSRWNCRAAAEGTVEKLTMALMPYCPQRHKAMFLHEFQGFIHTVQCCLFSIFLGSARTARSRVRRVTWRCETIKRSNKAWESSAVPSRDCTPTTTILALLLGRDVIVKEKTYTTSWFPPHFSSWKAAAPSGVLKHFSFFGISICVGDECSVHDGFSAMSFSKKC